MYTPRQPEIPCALCVPVVIHVNPSLEIYAQKKCARKADTPVYIVIENQWPFASSCIPSFMIA